MSDLISVLEHVSTCFYLGAPTSMCDIFVLSLFFFFLMCVHVFACVLCAFAHVDRLVAPPFFYFEASSFEVVVQAVQQKNFELKFMQSHLH